jgi:hypothetical protein
MNFKSKAAYSRWLAYAKMHGKPGKKAKPVTIKGKKHKVNHSKSGKKK